MGNTDIYGKPLPPGHCDVHPHVAEPHPCFICKERRVGPSEPAPRAGEQLSVFYFWTVMIGLFLFLILTGGYT